MSSRAPVVNRPQGVTDTGWDKQHLGCKRTSYFALVDRNEYFKLHTRSGPRVHAEHLTLQQLLNLISTVSHPQN